MYSEKGAALYISETNMLSGQRNETIESFKYRIYDNIFDANRALQGGAVYLDNSKSVLFSNNTFLRNKALLKDKN